MGKLSSVQHVIISILVVLSFPPVMLSQWVEEMDKLLMARQSNLSARMHSNHQDIRSHQTAMQIAQAARMHAANQKQASAPHFHGLGQGGRLFLRDRAVATHLQLFYDWREEIFIFVLMCKLAFYHWGLNQCV